MANSRAVNETFSQGTFSEYREVSLTPLMNMMLPVKITPAAALCVLGDGDVGAELGAGSRAQPALRHQHRHRPLPGPGGQTGVAGPGKHTIVWVEYITVTIIHL